MNKNDVFVQIVEGALQFEFGREFTLAEAFGEDWDEIPPAIRRQSCKEIKIAISLRELRGFIYLGKNSHGTYRYLRIAVRENRLN